MRLGIPRIELFVAATCLGAVSSIGYGLIVSPTTPGALSILGFLFVALMLESEHSRLRVEATGSLAFIMHLAALLVFGWGWAALIAASGGAIFVLKRYTPIKIVFNSSQFVLSVSAASLVYSIAGGAWPPAYFAEGASIGDAAVKRDVLAFLIAAASYFLTNSTLVSIAVCLSSGRKFREVWTLNTRGIFGYDLVASALAIPVAIAFSWWGGFGLILAVLPIIAIRHFYGLYRQLQESGQELLAVMVKAIEARDPYTSGHSERVSRISRAVALELGLPTQQVEEISTAALLHDVGKIHEEFAPLLRKEARLTPEETALMQTHVVKSAELVGIVSKFRGRILDAVRHHHERWDGQGYPDGVQGKAIPIGARIILVADTVDAMTTDRPYRKALGLDVVLAELQRCKGTQFDPELVELFSGSVAIRRLISEASLSGDMSTLPDQPLASRRIAFATGSFWRRRGA
jgi:putative nucleotidyltransferase with HDIG domain